MAQKYAYLFPGQGAQEPGMLKDIIETFGVAKKVLDDVANITSIDMAKLLWESDKAILSRSDNSQVAVMTSALVVCAVLKEKGLMPSAAMGFSLGEFPALYAAGVLSFEDTVKVVQKRGQIMQKVCEKIAKENEGAAPGMSAIMGLAPEKVAEICDSIENVYAANFNSVRQTVISGTFAALEQAEIKAKEAGAKRAIRLAVAGPYHCPLMQEAADEFKSVIDGVTFNDPSIALFSNYTGRKVTTGKEAKENALPHMVRPVRWTQEEAALLEWTKADGNEWVLYETGVGRVLSGLWKDFSDGASLSCTPMNTIEALSNL